MQCLKTVSYLKHNIQHKLGAEQLSTIALPIYQLLQAHCSQIGNKKMRVFRQFKQLKRVHQKLAVQFLRRSKCVLKAMLIICGNPYRLHPLTPRIQRPEKFDRSIPQHIHRDYRVVSSRGIGCAVLAHHFASQNKSFQCVYISESH